MEDVQVIDVVTGIAQTSAQAIVAIAFKVLLSLLVLLLVKLVNRAIDRLLTKASQKVHPKISPLMAGFVDKVLSSIVWLLGILIVLQIWGINMAPVIAGLGITGVVLGFALQESISNIFSGLLLALNNPFGIGDYVIIGSIEGTVVSMDAFSVTLATGDRKKVTMANKLVLADPDCLSRLWKRSGQGEGDRHWSAGHVPRGPQGSGTDSRGLEAQQLVRRLHRPPMGSQQRLLEGQLEIPEGHLRSVE